ncbi:MAG: chlorophyll synthesis pathway protein BchC [Parvularculaceae bacterium]|nr:chlorophyll synthesis pathway protein BchC [Parvularculaceae bacterium]
MHFAPLDRTTPAALAGQSQGAATVELASTAVIFLGSRKIAAERVDLLAPGDGDLVVDVDFSGVSTGTERLMWSSEMPAFPGLGYPLVPGYESVGRVIAAGVNAQSRLGETVFVPGSRAFKDVRGLFGGASSRVVIASDRAKAINPMLADKGALLALAATAYHAINGHAIPDLIIGHGVFGRLLARLAIALGGEAPVVWEINPDRASADGYAVIEPDCDGRRDYKAIYDASGDASIIDNLVARLAPRGEITLAGFYRDRPSFNFAPAFMREARLRIAAEWSREDLDAVHALVASGALSLDGLITHVRDFGAASEAYDTAFGDPLCLKMIIDWRELHGRII